MKKNTVLDKFTLGKTPAAVYLVDKLNENYTRRECNFILHKVHNFTENFNELVAAYNAKQISARTVASFIEQKLALLEQEQLEIIKRGFAPLIADLYKNIIVGLRKKFIRGEMKKAQTDRAVLLLLKNAKAKNSPLLSKRPTTFVLEHDGNLFDILINSFGKVCVIGRDVPEIDSINADILIEKSHARLARRTYNKSFS